MKKHLLLVSTLAISLMSSQTNDALKREFEKQRIENNAKFDSYVAKRYGANKSPEVLKEIEEQRSFLAGFMPNGKPYFNSINDFRQSKNANADFIQDGQITGITGSINGENIKITVFDGGRIFGGHSLFNNIANRITNKESSSMNYSAHATGVAGFIGAKDFNFTGSFGSAASFTNLNLRGVAKNSVMDSYAFATTTLPGDFNTSTVFQKILTAQPKISNHSYGTNQGWTNTAISGAWYWVGEYDAGISYDLQGTYLSNDQNYDNIVYNNPSYIIVKSSGNYYGMGPFGNSMPKYYENASGNVVQFSSTDVLPPNNCANGYDCIGPGSLAKNIIVVGATDILPTSDERYSDPFDVFKSGYSSAGPRDDGGIKPDISAVGTDVVTGYTAENTVGSSSYQYGSGTSYSAPIVTGIIGLWTQINKQLFSGAELNASSAKTLMIHSAYEAGENGPDPWTGWGFINAKRGAELLVAKANNTIIFNDETLNSGVINKKTVKATGTTPLKVTISWIDPAFVIPTNIPWTDAYNNRSSRLVNDLDVRIVDTVTNTVYYPWKLNANSPMDPATKGDNTVDNVEQVVLDNPVGGRNYRVEITNKGTLVNNTGVSSPSNYSIIVTGYNELVLGTGETNNISRISIAPTITKDIVKVLKAPKKSTYKIFDLTGKLLKNGTINSDEISLDLSSFTNGIYIIEVKTDKDIITKKIIKE